MKNLILLFLLPALLLVSKSNAALHDKIGMDAVAVARTDDMSKFSGGVGLRLSYDITPRLGLVVQADGSDTHGALIESTFAAIKFGFPVKLLGPVKPYLIGGGGFKFPGLVEYAAGGGGLEYTRGALRVFVEATAEKTVETPVAGAFAGGIGFRF
jgi:hypothetical protein